MFNNSNLITSAKVRFPKKKPKKLAPKYKNVKRKTVIYANGATCKTLKITEKTLLAGGVTREDTYTATKLAELLKGKASLGAVYNFFEKLTKVYFKQEIPQGFTGATNKVGYRKIACVRGSDMYDLAIKRDAGLLERKKYRNFNDNSIKLPATLYMRKKKKYRKRKTVLKKCECCGSDLKKGHHMKKITTYSEMLRASGKFDGILQLKKLRSNIFNGKRSYVKLRS